MSLNQKISLLYDLECKKAEISKVIAEINPMLQHRNENLKKIKEEFEPKHEPGLEKLSDTMFDTASFAAMCGGVLGAVSGVIAGFVYGVKAHPTNFFMKIIYPFFCAFVGAVILALAGAVIFAIIGLIISPILNKKTNEQYSHKLDEYNQQLKLAKMAEKVAVMEHGYKDKWYSMLNEHISMLEKESIEVDRCLNRLYEEAEINPTFRNLNAVEIMCKFIKANPSATSADLERYITIMHLNGNIPTSSYKPSSYIEREWENPEYIRSLCTLTSSNESKK